MNVQWGKSTPVVLFPGARHDFCVAWNSEYDNKRLTKHIQRGGCPLFVGYPEWMDVSRFFAVATFGEADF